MSDRKYYAERKGIKFTLNNLKEGFLVIYRKMKNESYLRQAEGHGYINAQKKISHINGIWGSDVSGYIFLKTKLAHTYPFSESIINWDEKTLFTIIEFLYDYVSDAKYVNYEHIYDKDKGKLKYSLEINSILSLYKNGYELKKGEIFEIPSSNLTSLLNQELVTDDPLNIDDRVNKAVNKYLKYGSTLDEKKEAVRNIGDVLEYLRTQNIKLPSKDDSDLFRIINGFDIRHHKQDQQGSYDKEVTYDWMFYTFLSSINYLLKLNGKDKTSS